MIAHDTGYEYIDESDIKVDDLNLLKEKLTGDVVIQAPGVMRWIHEIDCFPVIVKRAVKDIIKSQERIDWKSEEYELEKYGKKEGCISKVKYDYWAKNQKPKLKDYKEILYSSLKKHPLYIEDREHFNYNQTI